MSTSDDLSSFSPVLVHWTKQGSSGQDTILTLPMWKRLENTDSFNATTLKKALAYGGEAVGGVVRAIKAGEHLPMPVVHKLDNGVYWLASGNEVLLALRALRIAPVINLQIPETDDTVEFTDESLQNLEIHTEATEKKQQPSLSDLESAIDHADVEQEGWSLEDFHLSFLGNLSVEDLYQYDDIDSWLDVTPSDYADLSVKDRLRQLAGFRGAEWASRAAKWVNVGIPPIVIIESPDGTMQIGDGRGRVNFALAMNMRLPVYLLKHKNITEAMGLSTGGAGLAASGQVSGGPTSGGVLWSDSDQKKDVKTASPALHEGQIVAELPFTKAYHATLKTNLSSILTKGLEPRAEAKLAPHPIGVYMVSSLMDAWSVAYQLNQVLKKKLGKQQGFDFVVLSVDLNQLPTKTIVEKDVQSQREAGFYTTSAIPPEAIEFVEEISAKTLLNANYMKTKNQKFWNKKQVTESCGTQPIGEKKGIHSVGKDIYIQTDNKLEADRVKSMIKNKDKTNQPGLSKPTPITGILTKEALSMKAIQKELVEERKELTKLVEARLNLLESSILTEDKHVKLCEKKLVKEMRRLMEVMLKEEISKMELSEISQLIVAGASLVSGDVATGSATQVGGHRIPKVATVGKLVNFDLMKKVFSGYVKLRKEYSEKIQQATTSRAQGGELQQINMDPNMYKFEKFLVTNVAKLAKFFTALTKASGLIKSGKAQTEKAASFREMTSIFQSVEGLDARETALAIMSLDKDSQTGLANLANDTFRTTNLQQLSQGMRDTSTDYDPRDEYGHAPEGPQANASAPAISISPEPISAVPPAPSVFQRAKNWFSSRFASNPTTPPPLTVPPPRVEKRPTTAMKTSSSPPVLPPNAPTMPPANQRRRTIPVPGMTV